MRGLLRLFENPEFFLEFIRGVLSYCPSILPLLLAIFIVRNYKREGSDLVLVGAVITLIITFGYFFMNFIYMRFLEGGYESVTYIYTFLNIIGAVGRILFLYGIYKLIKGAIKREQGGHEDILVKRS